MQIENRLNFIREFFESARVAEQGYIPVTEQDEQEALSELDAFAEREVNSEEDEEFGPSQAMRDIFGE